MTRDLEFSGLVTGGHLPPTVRHQIADSMRKMEGKRLSVKIAEFKKRRSNNQNRFYFGPFIKAIREWFLEQGYVFSADEIHDFLWRKVVKKTEIVILPDGTEYERRLSSTTNSTTEWERDIDIIRAWAAERDLQLPFPNEGEEQ